MNEKMSLWQVMLLVFLHSCVEDCWNFPDERRARDRLDALERRTSATEQRQDEAESCP